MTTKAIDQAKQEAADCSREPSTSRETEAGLEDYWTEAAKAWLLGKTVIAVQFVPLDSCGKALVLLFDDGTVAQVMADPEGNGPGSLWVEETPDDPRQESGAYDILGPL